VVLLIRDLKNFSIKSGRSFVKPQNTLFVIVRTLNDSEGDAAISSYITKIMPEILKFYGFMMKGFT